MRTLRRLSRILEDIENKGTDPEDVVIDPRAIHLIVPDDAEEPEPPDEDD